MPNTGRRIPPHDLIFYHWSPRERRDRIRRMGFKIKSRSIDGMWRPPYICFSDDVLLGWQLSGGMWSDHHDEWDLWQVYPHYLEGWEVIFDTYTNGKKFAKEYRVYHDIPKSKIAYLGSRTQSMSFR